MEGVEEGGGLAVSIAHWVQVLEEALKTQAIWVDHSGVDFPSLGQVLCEIKELLGGIGTELLQLIPSIPQFISLVCLHDCILIDPQLLSEVSELLICFESTIPELRDWVYECRAKVSCLSGEEEGFVNDLRLLNNVGYSSDEIALSLVTEYLEELLRSNSLGNESIDTLRVITSCFMILPKDSRVLENLRMIFLDALFAVRNESEEIQKLCSLLSDSSSCLKPRKESVYRVASYNNPDFLWKELLEMIQIHDNKLLSEKELRSLMRNSLSGVTFLPQASQVLLLCSVLVLLRSSNDSYLSRFRRALFQIVLTDFCEVSNLVLHFSTEALSFLNVCSSSQGLFALGSILSDSQYVFGYPSAVCRDLMDLTNTWLLAFLSLVDKDLGFDFSLSLKICMFISHPTVFEDSRLSQIIEKEFSTMLAAFQFPYDSLKLNSNVLSAEIICLLAFCSIPSCVDYNDSPRLLISKVLLFLESVHHPPFHAVQRLCDVIQGYISLASSENCFTPHKSYSGLKRFAVALHSMLLSFKSIRPCEHNFFAHALNWDIHDKKLQVKIENLVEKVENTIFRRMHVES